MVKKHIYKLGKTSFINPYNFVSLPDKVKKSAYQEGNPKENLTGYLDVSLETLTPLFIPNTTNEHYYYPENTEHKSEDFYSYEDLSNKTADNRKNYAPVIPGSELRGCIKSIHEIQNDSCMANTDYDMYFARRSAPKNNMFSPYILFWENNHYRLYKAERKVLKQKNYQEIFTKLKADGNNKFIEKRIDNYYDSSTLQEQTSPQVVLEKHLYFCRIGEPFINNNRRLNVYRIIGKDDDLTKDEIKRFKKTLKDYSDSKINKAIDKGHTGYLDVLDRLEHHLPVLVFVRTNDDKKSLSPASIGKYMCPDDLSVFLKEYEPCKSLDDCCLTCQIFGFVDQNENNKGETHSSRIRFTDATTSQNPDDCYDSWRTIKPLLGPHPSNAIFYGHNPENRNYRKWAWDKATGIKIRGRKLYFHSNDAEKNGTNAKDILNLTIHPVKKGVSFSFKVYYENLTKEQLESLIKSINLYNSITSKQYAHKIGHAKPFGYGSVRMKVGNIIQRKVEKENGHIVYKETPINVRTVFNEDNSSSDKQLKVMTNTYLLRHDEIHVIYPITDSFKNDDDKGFEWFGNNIASSSSNFCTQILPYLPDIVKKEEFKNDSYYQNIVDKISLKTNKKEEDHSYENHHTYRHR